MTKYIISTLTFVLSWVCGVSLYIAGNGFNAVYGADTFALVFVTWVVSCTVAVCVYCIILNEEKQR